MRRTKFVIFGLRHLVLDPDGTGSSARFIAAHANEFTKLIEFIRSKGIQPVVFANHSWTITKKDGSTIPFKDFATEKWGEMPWFIANQQGLPQKPRAEAMAEVLRRLGCEANEVLYIGNSDTDMRTAVNGGVLFLNGTWIHDKVDYGFKFASPKEIARFIDIFCVREHSWEFEINQGQLRYYALAPFSTYYEQYQSYSGPARSLAKDGSGDATFWGQYLCSTIFLSGLYNEIDYVCPFPSHAAGTWGEPLRGSIEAFSKCFRIQYIPDLIVRHTTAPASHRNRDSASHLTHLNTIRVNRTPQRGKKRFKSFPPTSGKTVLIVDDFCTEGYSLEAARIYLERAGLKVILVTWLKTINRSYRQLQARVKRTFNPYEPGAWDSSQLAVTDHAYAGARVDSKAHEELGAKHAEWSRWDSWK